MWLLFAKAGAKVSTFFAKQKYIIVFFARASSLLWPGVDVPVTRWPRTAHRIVAPCKVVLPCYAGIGAHCLVVVAPDIGVVVVVLPLWGLHQAARLAYLVVVAVDDAAIAVEDKVARAEHDVAIAHTLVAQS